MLQELFTQCYVTYTTKKAWLNKITDYPQPSSIYNNILITWRNRY